MSVNTGCLSTKTGSGQPDLPFWPVLITLFLGSFVGMYHVVSLNVSLPGFIGIFDTELRTVQWIITGFSLACGMITPVSGYLCDRFGGKSMFLLSLAGITVGSILCALSWNIYALIGFRMVQGLFCGLIQPISLTMIYQTLPRERQPLAVSVWSFSTVLGTAIGPSLSGWFQQHDWHLIFLVTVPIGVAAWIAALLLLPSGFTRVRKRLDLAGLVLATMGSLALLLLFGNMHAWGMQSLLTWGCLIIGGLCAVLFVRVELQTREPLLNLRLFRNVTFTISLTVSLILTFALYSGVYFIPLFLEEIQGMTPFQVGLLFLPAAACLTIATFLSGKWYASWGAALLIALGSLILLVTTFRFSRLHVETTLISVMVWMCIRNVGSGLALSPATSAAMAAVTEQESGHASALLNWLRQVFSSISLGMFTSLFYARMNVHESRLLTGPSDRSPEWLHMAAYTRSIDDVFLIASALVALAVPLALLLRRRGRAVDSGSSKISDSM
ncbi:DHA2 family efflux MFS transporter permease subunit [Paenibacillus sp. N3/727]|uniref:DHA2 family efflux MFS transporter permease subunit n=1 Tax=Paenibacillus sp. N3/727 TaxID=2925845 RepID=UPI001F5336DA|nr:DHA2 family efflux MFS transporter permease subunit [Paenibacillus sp. N3/727]UNK19500.1 DHA2 family efflux MFS transporter permease subunit [Paenibacillus sp. N3/727]